MRAYLLTGLIFWLMFPSEILAQDADHNIILRDDVRNVERLDVLYALRKQEEVSEAAFATLAEFISTTEDSSLQGEAINVVRKHPEAVGVNKVLPAIRTVATESADWYPRRHAILALSVADGPSDTSREIFLANLTHEHASVRASAVRAIADNPQPMEETVTLLVRALEDEDAEPREKAAAGLYELSRSSSHYLVHNHWNAIAPHVKDKKSEMVQAHVLGMMSQLIRKKYTLDDAQIVDAINHGIASEHTFVLKSAMRLLKRVGADYADDLAPRLEELTKHESPTTAYRAEQALEMLQKK